MSVTDELRAELTRRGIEWRWEDERTTYWYVTVDGDEWGEWTAIEMGGYLHLSFSSGDVLTPAQAIAATLGSGTVEKAAERIEVLSGFAREYLHRYGMLMSMAGEDVTDEVLAMESAINEVCGRKVVDE